MKKVKATKPRSVDRRRATKKLIVGGIAVSALAVVLSIAVAKGLLSSIPRGASAAFATADGVGVSTGWLPPTSQGIGQGLATMSRAAADNKYLFAFFWSSETEQTVAMRKVFAAATAKIADRALAVSIRVTDPAESGIVKKYDLDRAPMPLASAIAPSGTRVPWRRLVQLRSRLPILES